MNICLVIPSLELGGAEKVASLLAEYFSDRHKVVFLIFEKPLSDFSVKAEVKTINCGGSKSILVKIKNLFLRPFLISRFIRKNKIDRVISFLEICNIPCLVGAICFFWLDKLTISVHSNPFFYNSYRKWWAKNIYPFSNNIVFVSEGIQKWYESNISCYKKNTTVIYNPINFSEIMDLALKEPDLDLPSGPFLVAVGRLTQSKNYPGLIHAYSLLPNTAPPLVIVGKGEGYTELIKKVEELKLKNKIFFPGATRNPYAVMFRAQCMILNSFYEGFAIVVVEALACGTQVVSTNCDFGPREILENGKFGELCSPDDPINLAKAITHILQGSSSISKEIMQKRAADFDINKIGAKWDKLIGA